MCDNQSNVHAHAQSFKGKRIVILSFIEDFQGDAYH